MKTLFIVNAPPYGTEYAYNALRLAVALAARPDNQVRLFLLGDGAACAKSGQKVPEGYYNIQTMLERVAQAAPQSVGVCGACMKARGIEASELVPGAHQGTLAELAGWTEWADKVLVF
ncbi:MAG: hypothetical protein COX57_09515 [Alphaproteobacteria bacterium CG_4_10_14_0_2_um_filter_63_37]|nr:MAG: hypothetical protein AUJ55_02630 [Proteobacteria bacterium CG1_02_64_396]PJA24232.1 MAG: hypothetical protein COX57_09515 [Alphaproteobacteria bacterium CG_4_10_14_0_2_um_filter_63_37]